MGLRHQCKLWELYDMGFPVTRVVISFKRDETPTLDDIDMMIAESTTTYWARAINFYFDRSDDKQHLKIWFGKPGDAVMFKLRFV